MITDVQPIRSSSPGRNLSPSSAFWSSSRKKNHPGEKELPPWKSSDKHPTDIIHFNYLDNCDPIEHTQLARVRTVPFSTSFLLETTYWHFGLRKDENRSYCEIQMLFTGGGGLVTESCQTLCNPMDCSPPGSSVHGDSPGKTTGVGCHSFFQGIIPTQGSKLHLLHCRWILYCWATREAPRSKKWLKVNEPLLVNLTFSLGFVCTL